jgi:FkbM family methyltransferase
MSIKITFFKDLLKSLLVALLGYQNYLYIICRYRIAVFKYCRRGKEFLHFLSLIPPNTVVFDIGANTGYTTYYLANNKNLLVESIEPEQNNIAVLRKIVSRFSNVTVLDVAIGNSNEIAQLITPIIANVKAHPLCYIYRPGDPYPKEFEINYIKINKLDDIPKFNCLEKPLSALRISVQGYEHLVLYGGKNLIIKYRPIISCDIWDVNNKYEIFNWLIKLNYRAFMFYRGNLMPVDILDGFMGNIFFIPQGNSILI